LSICEEGGKVRGREVSFSVEGELRWKQKGKEQTLRRARDEM